MCQRCSHNRDRGWLRVATTRTCDRGRRIRGPITQPALPARAKLDNSQGFTSRRGVATVVLGHLLGVMSEHPDMPSKPTVDRGKRRQYRIVAVSLYDSEIEIADRLTGILRTAGWPTANRSFVIREALLRLNDDLADREPEE